MDDLDRLERNAPPHYAPLIFAAQKGFGLFVILQDSRMACPEHFHGSGTVVVIGDDMETSKGPAAFDTEALRRFLGTCATVVILAADANVQLYAGVAMCVARGVAERWERPNGVIIETQPAHETDWHSLVANADLPETTAVILGTHVARHA